MRPTAQGEHGWGRRQARGHVRASHLGKPVHQVPEQQLTDALQKYETIVIVEEAATGSGIREKVAWMLSREGNNHRVFGLDLGQEYVTHGNVNALYAHHGLDANSIAKYVKEVLKVEN